jgi:hypothetical protein
LLEIKKVLQQRAFFYFLVFLIGRMGLSLIMGLSDIINVRVRQPEHTSVYDKRFALNLHRFRGTRP